MNIKEFVFKKQTQSELPDHRHVVLTCKDCGNLDTRPKHEPFSGHMYEQSVTYTCTVCRGNMNLLTEDDETEN
jgi:hypothetical protein